MNFRKAQLLNRILPLLWFILLAGCSSQIPLTTALLKEYQLSSAEVQQLQLYLSTDLLLEQAQTVIGKDVDAQHALKTTEDSYVKQIQFKSKIPCISVDTKPDRLAVAFENGDNLDFVLASHHPKGLVYVYQPEKKGREEQAPNRLASAGYAAWKYLGRETYKDSSYIVLVKYETPYLLVDERGLKKLVLDRRAVKGL
jgi:hypothetical protein